MFLLSEIYEALNYVIGEGSRMKGSGEISQSGGMSDGTGVIACSWRDEPLAGLGHPYVTRLRKTSVPQFRFPSSVNHSSLSVGCLPPLLRYRVPLRG